VKNGEGLANVFGGKGITLVNIKNYFKPVVNLWGPKRCVNVYLCVGEREGRESVCNFSLRLYFAVTTFIIIVMTTQ